MTHGPWTTALGNTSAAPLSRFWRRRMKELPGLAQRKPPAGTWRIVFAIIFLLGLGMPTLKLATGSANDAEEKQPDVVADSNTPGQPLQVELPGGVLAELVAVGSPVAKKDDWWGPDGSLIDAPCRHLDNSMGSLIQFPREFVVRWANEVPSVTVQWSIVDPGTWHRYGPVGTDRDGNQIENLHVHTASFPLYRKTCTLRFSAAAGAWKTIADNYGGHGSSGHNLRYSYTFAPVAERHGDVVASASHDATGQDARLVAIDHEGNEIPPDQCSSYSGRGFQQTSATFRNRHPDDFDKYLLQVRPFEHVDVQGVPLSPGAGASPTIVR